jgi:hypothetical protein
VQRAGGKNVFARDAVVYHEVVNLAPLKWLTRKSNSSWYPLLLKLAPDKRSYLLNRVFPYHLGNYRLLFTGIITTVIFLNPVFLVLCIPYGFVGLRDLKADILSPRTMIRGIMKFVFIALRNIIHYLAFVYGGIKHRNPVF